MNIKRSLFIILFFLFLIFNFPLFAMENESEVSARLQDIINNKTTTQCHSAFICDIKRLKNLYELNNYQPLWIKKGKITNNAYDFLRFASNIGDEGLDPKTYKIESISEMIKNASITNSPYDFAFLDISLSSSFLNLASHLVSGRIDPRAVYDSWSFKKDNIDFGPLLNDVISSEGNVTDILRGIINKNPHYLGLKSYLKKYREIAQNGGWEKFGDSPKLERGSNNKKVQALRQILYATGDYAGGNLISPYFDSDLEKAVIKFQKRHGLEPDGKVGQQTANALNVPVEERIKQIELNMESWRWLPRDLGERYLIINIANFELEVFEKGKKIIQMKTVVGRPYRMTPVFISEINQIVLNPSWHVPRSIAVNDILPDIKNNIGAISKKKLKVYARGKNGVSEINPYQANWSQINKKNFNYYLVQPPGDFNALGRIKFNLPNEFDVYLHDTPQKNLFSKNKRDFSSGCVRLENPLELAFYLLKDDKNWPRERIEKTIEKGKTVFINLAKTLPAYFLYWTAWVDENNDINFREDIYDREKIMEKILQGHSKHDKKDFESIFSFNREGSLLNDGNFRQKEFFENGVRRFSMRHDS